MYLNVFFYTYTCTVIKNKNKSILKEKDCVFILDIKNTYFFLNPINNTENFSKNARIVLNKHTARLIN